MKKPGEQQVVEQVGFAVRKEKNKIHVRVRDKIRLCAHAHGGTQLFCGVQIARHFVAVSSGLATRKRELERK
jgi:hypothetical protein